LAALAAMMSLPAAAQEYSNGGHGIAGRGPAILTPVEAYGVHPPGLDPADARSHNKARRQIYYPYYAPVSPVASSARWKPWCYYPLLPWYTPYYCGYCPHRLFNPPPRPYGCDGWGKGPMPEEPLPETPGKTPLRYGAYTSVVEDDTTYWNMGGNGLVPYGEQEPFRGGEPDLIDDIQASRAHGHGHIHHGPHVEETIILSPVEVDAEPEKVVSPPPDRSSRRRTKSAERSAR
jgi:hypothetical protein